MTHYIHTVRSRALVGRVDEYRNWYVATHIPEVLAFDGYSSAEFFADTDGADSVGFFCVYQLETDDLPGLQAAMVAAGQHMTPSPAMDVPATHIEFFERLSA